MVSRRGGSVCKDQTYEKDVDKEVGVAATLEEDTDWWEEDGKAGRTTSESNDTVSYMGHIQNLRGTVSTADTRTRGRHRRTLQMSDAVKAMVVDENAEAARRGRRRYISGGPG